jgi:DNA-binding transcriptional LysR family regulator
LKRIVSESHLSRPLEGLAAKQLVEVLEAYAPPARPLYAVHAGGGRVSPAARAFLEIAKRHLERLGWQTARTADFS